MEKRDAKQPQEEQGLVETDGPQAAAKCMAEPKPEAKGRPRKAKPKSKPSRDLITEFLGVPPPGRHARLGGST